MLISGLVLWWPIRGWPKKEKFEINWSVSPEKLDLYSGLVKEKNHNK